MHTKSWLRTVLTFVLLVGMYFPTATISQASSGSSVPLFDTTVTSTRFVDVVVGDNHTCGLRANGTVMCWGYNGTGQVGDTVRITLGYDRASPSLPPTVAAKLPSRDATSRATAASAAGGFVGAAGGIRLHRILRRRLRRPEDSHQLTLGPFVDEIDEDH